VRNLELGTTDPKVAGCFKKFLKKSSLGLAMDFLKTLSRAKTL
jgi:hypothetical protein